MMTPGKLYEVTADIIGKGEVGTADVPKWNPDRYLFVYDRAKDNWEYYAANFDPNANASVCMCVGEADAGDGVRLKHQMPGFDILVSDGRVLFIALVDAELHLQEIKS